MNKLPDKLRDAAKLEQAIKEAQQIADAKGVPLTLERLAVVVGVSRQDLGAIANGTLSRFGDVELHTDVVAAVKKAVDICVADVMEHGMIRGNSPIMPIFALKCNHGYDDKPQASANVTIVLSDKDIPD